LSLPSTEFSLRFRLSPSKSEKKRKEISRSKISEELTSGHCSLAAHRAPQSICCGRGLPILLQLPLHKSQRPCRSEQRTTMAQHNNNNNRNSPHLNHLQNGSAPPSPSMSNAQQQPGQSRQPVNYPSPTSYPSPSLSSAQQYYPGQQDPSYRASPTGSNGSLSLPSMRSLDPLQQQQQAQHHMGSPLPPPVAQMGGPYYHNQGQTLPHPNHQYPNVTSDPTGQNMRYALPVTDARVMSGGRHKKVRRCFIVVVFP